MQNIWAVAALLLLNALFFILPLSNSETDAPLHDPSTIVERDGVYWVYATGNGVAQFSSTDRVHWTNRGRVLKNTPDWVPDTVPGNKNDHFWAPDLLFFNGKYHLYYSVSTFGSNVSAIALATNSTLDPDNWKDQGIVVQSTRQENYNAIDPAVFSDRDRKLWMTFGSFFSGIKLIALDPKTGKRPSGDTEIRTIATRPDTRGNPIEAPYLADHDGYYYLFVNWDRCCAGPKSSYNVRVGRSKMITGPYLDKTGKALTEGGGTLFLTTVYDNETGRPVDDQVGPGHIGILRDSAGEWVSVHYEWARRQNGRSLLNVFRLQWDDDGWPRAVLPSGPYKIVSALATHGVVTPTSAGSLVSSTFTGDATQTWLLQDVGGGFYHIVNAATNKKLAVNGTAESPPWLLRQNDDGTYTLLSKTGDQSLALDIKDCALHDGAPVQVWTSNDLDCQKWSFRRP